MKWKLGLIMFVLVASVGIGAATAQAQEPQPYLYAMPKCSGLSLTQLEWAQQDYDTAYGWQNGLVTDWQWQASYEARANEFAALVGCPQVLDDGALTRWYRYYVPTYQRILRNVPE